MRTTTTSYSQGWIGSKKQNPWLGAINPLDADFQLAVSTLTLTNLVIGSAIRIEIQSTGALVEFRTATLTTEVFTVPVYSSGSASNDLRIKVRKASSGTAYIPYQTLVTAVIGSQPIYVSQIQDE